MPVIERECAEHIHWHPYVTVEKYSLDQTAWAERKLDDALGWRRLPLLRKIGIGERRGPVVDGAHAGTWRRHRAPDGTVRTACDPHGDWLREVFPCGPEDGYAYDDGNILVNQGLTMIIYNLTGLTPPANTFQLKNGQTVVGVGDNSGTVGGSPSTADVHLNANGANAYYQGSDVSGSGYPLVTTPATINNQCTYASGSANFAWNEWCWATGNSISAAGATLASVFTTSADVAMINHKIPAQSLGTKAPGASWVFSTTIVFS